MLSFSKKVTRKFTVNGQEYNSFEDLPDEIKERIDTSKNGETNLYEEKVRYDNSFTIRPSLKFGARIRSTEAKPSIKLGLIAVLFYIVLHYFFGIKILDLF